jgi:hypothetical protein
MTDVQYATLLSAIFGAAGTIFLFFGSYTLEPLAGAVWGGPVVDKENAKIRGKNKSRILRQRIGLVFLCLSFIIQVVSVFLPNTASP